MKSDWLNTIMTLLILLTAVTAGFCVHFWVGIFISITILVWSLVVVPSKNKKIMAIKRIENLERLSELFQQQANLESLKLPIRKKTNIKLSITMSVDGNIGSVCIKDLEPKQVLDMLNSILSVNKKLISDFIKENTNG